MYCTISQHTARRKHKRPCEWCGEPIDKGDRWAKNVCMGEEFNSIEMHDECHDKFQEEFKHYWPGAYLAIEAHCNERGEPAKEGTVYEV